MRTDSATPSRSASHELTVDEPAETGGNDAGPSPQELLAAQPRRLHRHHDGDVRRAQGLGHRRRRGRVRLHARRARLPDALRDRRSRFPTRLTDEQVERLRVDRRQVPGPPHARGRGHVRRACRARRARAADLRARAAAGPPRPPRRPRRSTSTAASTPPCSCRCTSPAASCTSSSPAGARTCAATPARSRSPAGARTTTRPTCALTALREAQEEIGLPARRRRARRRAAADADDRDQLRRLSLRRADRARSRRGQPSAARGRRGAGAARCARCARATGAGGCCAAASRSAPTPTWSARTSSGARRRGSSPTCSTGCPRTCAPPAGAAADGAIDGQEVVDGRARPGTQRVGVARGRPRGRRPGSR